MQEHTEEIIKKMLAPLTDEEVDKLIEFFDSSSSADSYSAICEVIEDTRPTLADKLWGQHDTMEEKKGKK
jgi:hypothetical protein